MFSNSAARVPAHTADWINQRIQRRSECSIAYYAAHPDDIGRRLTELDREWDVERALETMSAGLSLSGLALGLTRGRKWLLVPIVVQAFFLQHAVQGWCPPLPILRRLGYRTQQEIDHERAALMAIRGDFDRLRAQHAGANGHSKPPDRFAQSAPGPARTDRDDDGPHDPSERSPRQENL